MLVGAVGFSAYGFAYNKVHGKGKSQEMQRHDRNRFKESDNYGITLDQDDCSPIYFNYMENEDKHFKAKEILSEAQTFEASMAVLFPDSFEGGEPTKTIRSQYSYKRPELPKVAEKSELSPKPKKCSGDAPMTKIETEVVYTDNTSGCEHCDHIKRCKMVNNSLLLPSCCHKVEIHVAPVEVKRITLRDTSVQCEVSEYTDHKIIGSDEIVQKYAKFLEGDADAACSDQEYQEKTKNGNDNSYESFTVGMRSNYDLVAVNSSMRRLEGGIDRVNDVLRDLENTLKKVKDDITSKSYFHTFSLKKEDQDEATNSHSDKTDEPNCISINGSTSSEGRIDRIKEKLLKESQSNTP